MPPLSQSMRNLRLKLNFFIVCTAVSLFFLTGVIHSEEVPAVVLSHSAFSPNSDGYRDSVFISLKNISPDIRYPSNWIVTVKNAGGIPVNNFAADRRWIRAEPSFNNLFLPGRYDVRPLEIFNILEWNGRDKNGNIVPDGIYTLEVSVFGKKNGHVYNFPEIQVAVDTVPPELKLSPVDAFIIRPSDEKGHSLPILSEAVVLQKSDSPGSFTGSILDRNGNVIDKRIWDDILPEKAFWNGRTGNKDDANYGMYSYRLTAEDAAGNRSAVEFDNIFLIANESLFYLDCGKCIFRRGSEPSVFNTIFRGDKTTNDLLGIRNKNNVNWNVEIFSEKDMIPLYSSGGAGIPERLEWVAAADSEKKIIDGLYRIKLTLKYNNTIYESPFNYFYLDSAPPEISIEVSPDQFTPDGDGDDDGVLIYPGYKDRTAVDNWLLQIYIMPDAENTPPRIYRSFRGRNFLPKKIIWNGDGDGIKLLKSNEFLEVRFFVHDVAGNISSVARSRIKTGIIVETQDSEGKYLKINIPDQKYFDSSNTLTANGRRVLNELLDSLIKYGWYFIHVESHVSFPGREEENLDLSEKRAKSMFNFLSKKVYDEEKIDYRGFGETELQSKEDEAFSHYRNSRMEINLERLEMNKK